MLRRILILTMLFAVVTACSKSDTDKSGHSYALLQKDVPGVYENENSLFIYDNDLYQYAYNTSRHSFRIQNTSQSRYMACMLETAPVVDRYVKVTVETQGISSIPSQELQGPVCPPDTKLFIAVPLLGNRILSAISATLGVFINSFISFFLCNRRSQIFFLFPNFIAILLFPSLFLSSFKFRSSKPFFCPIFDTEIFFFCFILPCSIFI